MIKHFCIAFIILFLFVSPLTAYADVVYGNEFFYKNDDSIKLIGESPYGERFIVNSPSGYVIPKEEPGSKKGVLIESGYRGWEDEGMKEQDYPIFVFKNGQIIRIGGTFLHNGEYWGVIIDLIDLEHPFGWVLMDELMMIYDRFAFELENRDNFYEYTGSYDAVLSAEKLVEWQWPGSDREKRIIENKDTISHYAHVQYAYKDKDGREWGKTYYSEGWICLSEPENNKIPAFYPAPEPITWSPEGMYDWSSHDYKIYPPQNPENELITLASDYVVYNVGTKGDQEVNWSDPKEAGREVFKAIYAAARKS